jgi:hypothetical protein
MHPKELLTLNRRPKSIQVNCNYRDSEWWNLVLLLEYISFHFGGGFQHVHRMWIKVDIQY